MNLPLPDDVIQNHIIPYTYLIQSKELCKDIKTYHFTLNRITNLYKTVFEPDLYLSLLRLYITRYYYEQVLNISCNYDIGMPLLENDRNRKKNINLLWGKLPPAHRLKCWINKYKEIYDNTNNF